MSQAATRPSLERELAAELTGLMQPHATALKDGATLPSGTIAQMELRMGHLLSNHANGPGHAGSFGAFERFAPVVWHAIHDFADRHASARNSAAWNPEERISTAAVKLLDTLAHCCAYWGRGHYDQKHAVKVTAEMAATWLVGRMLRADATVCQQAPSAVPPASLHMHQLERHAREFAHAFGNDDPAVRRLFWKAVDKAAAGYEDHAQIGAMASQVRRLAATRHGARPAVASATMKLRM